MLGDILSTENLNPTPVQTSFSDKDLSTPIKLPLPSVTPYGSMEANYIQTNISMTAHI